MFAFAVLLVAIIAVLATGVIWHSRTKRIADAEREVGDLTRILGEQAERTIQSADLLLLAAIEELRSAHSPAAIHRVLRTRVLDAPHIRGISILDRNGVLIHNSRLLQPDPVDFSDRIYFRIFRDTALGDAYIGAELSGRMLSGAIIPVARRLTGPDGSFAGIIVAALDNGHFEQLYGEVARDGRRLLLVRDDGRVLLRHPHPADGAPTPTTPAYPDGDTVSTFRAADAATGGLWIYGRKRLGTLPVTLVLGLAEDTALADWSREAWFIAGSAGVVSTLLCLLIGLLARQVAHGERLSEALLRGESRFRDFAEASSDWFWEQDEQLRFTYLSSEVLEKSGLPVAAHLGKTRREVVFFGVDDAQWAKHDADLAARRPFRDFRFQRVGPEGEIHSVSVSGKPVFDASGVFRGYRGSGRDVTREVLGERRLREAKAEAEAASAAKGDFLAVMSHELRTPLNAIIGFSEVIAREVFGAIGNAKYREYAHDILSAGRHLLGLISNILDMSKIEARKMELVERPVDLQALIGECVRLMQPRAADRGISLVDWVSPDLPQLRGDEMRLRQVILNLLSNALKFTGPEGEITIRSTRREDGGIEIAIRDSGIGMSPDEVAIALQPFRQIESAFNRNYEGTGLGLPLAKALTELHGGTLLVESAPNEGTIVRIALPASRVQRFEDAA